MQKQRIMLRGLEGAQGKTWESEQRLRVGRLRTLEINLDDSSVSRQHAEMVRNGQGWAIRDLGSTNGTFLNEVRVGGAEEKLRQGDLLQFGDISIVVEQIESPVSDLKDFTSELEILQAIPQSWNSLEKLTCSHASQADLNGRLQRLIQIGRDFRCFDSLGSYLDSVLWEAAEFLDARVGAFALRDERTGSLSIRNSFAMSDLPGQDQRFKQGHAEWALGQGKTLLCRFAHPGTPETADEGAPQSTIFALLRSSYRELGVLCLARTADQAPFGEAELYLADALALAISAGIDSFDHLQSRQRDLLLQTLTTLTQLVNLRDDRAAGHSARVTEYALMIADKLALSDQDRTHLKMGTPLHDLGMFAIQDTIVQKPGPLNHKEKMQMRSHVMKGVALLESIPSLAALVPILRNHHEHWDGTGYPDGLMGNEIPLLARIVAVADAFDAMTTDRPFRPGLSFAEAFAEIESKAGSQFDPSCVRALQQMRPQLEERSLLTNTFSWTEMKKTLEAAGLGKGRNIQLRGSAS